MRAHPAPVLLAQNCNFIPFQIAGDGVAFAPPTIYKLNYTYLHLLFDAKMDIIFIDELRIATLIGIYPREQSVPQTLEISLQIGTSTLRAGSSDDIRDTIDYAEVVERLRAELEQRHFHLLEKLAEYVASVVLDDFGAVWTRVSVAKPGVMRGVRRVGVVIERSCPIQATLAT
jgi:dihydroneopterin aldolase